MSDLKQQRTLIDLKDDEAFLDINGVDDEDIEFIEYDIDEEAQMFHDDVESLSKEAKKKQEKAEGRCFIFKGGCPVFFKIVD